MVTILSRNVEAAIAALLKVLTDFDWKPRQDDGNPGIYLIDFGEPHTPLADAIATITTDTERFILYLNFGPTAAEDYRDETARFIALANWKLSIGNFEFDYDEGEVRFKTSIDFAGAELSEKLIRNAISNAMSAMEMYAGGLIEVMSGGRSAQGMEG